jgi:alkylhydroperoxidase family enzyme
MARLPYLTKDDLAPEDQDILATGSNLRRLLAHSPHGARAVGKFTTFLQGDCSVDPRLREMALVQIGYLTGQQFEYAAHIRLGLRSGASDDDFHAIAAETQGRPSGLNPLAKLVLKAAREMTLDLAISDDTYAALARSLSRKEVVDLIIAISFYCGMVRLLSSLQVDVPDDLLPYLEKFPLPES